MYKKRHMPFYFSGMEIPFSFNERTLLCAEMNSGKTYRLSRWAQLLFNQSFPFVYMQALSIEDKNNPVFGGGIFPFEYSDEDTLIISNIKISCQSDENTIERVLKTAFAYCAHIFIDNVNQKMKQGINHLLEEDYHNCTVAIQSIYDCDKSIGISFSEHLFDRIFIGKTSEAIIGSILGIETMFLLDIKPKTFLQRK